MQVDLKPEQIGTIPASGPVQWPTLDCFGQPYSPEERVNYTRRAVGGGKFTLIPPMKDSDDLTFKPMLGLANKLKDS